MIRPARLLLRGSPLAGENPQPFFREADFSASRKKGWGFPEDKYRGLGRETGFRVLPYTMQDRYNRELKDLEFPSVVMENEFLRAEFIPALGGRLWSLFDKKRNRDILYRNPLFRPANLAIRNAWFSGGIEWNIGRFGHSVHTCSPVFAGTFKAGDMEVFRIWEFERQTRLFWRIECTLPEGSPALFTYIRIENPDGEQKPLYWWTNTAVPQTPELRVFSASDEVLYLLPGGGNRKTMAECRLPGLPLFPGGDASFPAVPETSVEYFFQNDRAHKLPGGFPLPWESAVDKNGYAFAEASTLPLLYRKMFSWGNGPGGRHWQDFLSRPGEAYLEVQAGLAPTQLHTADIAGHATVDWAQAFTAFEADPDKTHQGDYTAAAAHIKNRLAEEINAAAVEAALEEGRTRSVMEAEILGMGSGWGALESHVKRRRGPVSGVPPGLSFPAASTGETESPWVKLLETGSLPLRPPEAGPGSFAVDGLWETLLEASPEREGDWLTPYHLGVIAFEKGETGKAAALWEKSLEREENPWACRNLALAALRNGPADQAVEAALAWYKRALCRDAGDPSAGDPSFMEEYIPLLLKAKKEEEAAARIKALLDPGGPERLSCPLLTAAAALALNRGDDALLDRIFSVEPAGIREGNTALVDLWVEREIRRRQRGGKTREEAEQEAERALAEGGLVPPREIDFRMIRGNGPQRKESP